MIVAIYKLQRYLKHEENKKNTKNVTPCALTGILAKAIFPAIFRNNSFKIIKISFMKSNNIYHIFSFYG